MQVQNLLTAIFTKLDLYEYFMRKKKLLFAVRKNALSHGIYFVCTKITA